MRRAEWIDGGAFLFLSALAFTRQLPSGRRAAIFGFGAAGLVVTAISTQMHSVVRDWTPAALVLLVYWQAGRFFTRVDAVFQRRLEDFDSRTVLRILPALRGRWLARYLELAYLFCYPMIPFSLAALYVLDLRSYADYFWAVVLPSTYFCYLMVPFFQCQPPRMLSEPPRAALPTTGVRKSNLWILDHASIHANTFPSAHVAASVSASLVLLHLNAAVGAVFLAIALSIAAGAVLGRYHYLADAIAGIATALVAYAVVAP